MTSIGRQVQDIWASEVAGQNSRKTYQAVELCQETSLAAGNKNTCPSKSIGPIALKIGVDVGTGLVYAPMKYETNRTPDSRDMGFGSRWSRFAEDVQSE